MSTFEILRNDEPFMTIQCNEEDAHLTIDEMCSFLSEEYFDAAEWKVKPEEQPSVIKEALISFMHTMGGRNEI